MAEYLIQDTTLDDIADAINAKTGGSSAMTPAEMVTAIAAIPSGGDDTPKAWTLANTVTIESGISNLSISLPSGYTEYALELTYELSAPSRVNIYHTSVASSRFMGNTNTSATQSNVVLVFMELQATTVDGISVNTRTAWSASTTWASSVVQYAMPTAILFTPSSSGVTWSSGTVKVYGR